ncbi:hypothetical protein BHM03_00008758 [Ensete ventricosum]|nr:hypothetical protein BHM03_00008758 [Ensete ventricosum]
MSIECGRCFRASEHTHMVYSMREHEAVVREGIKGVGVCNRCTARIARKESIDYVWGVRCKRCLMVLRECSLEPM